MKHIQYVRFMAKLWRAYDHADREIGDGFINDRGRAEFFYASDRDRFSTSGIRIPAHEILEDVNNQIDILQRPKI